MTMLHLLCPDSLAFLPGSVGGMELFVLFLVVLVLFGPKRLPEVARSIGKVMHDLRRASDDFRDQIMRLDAPPPPSVTPSPSSHVDDDVIDLEEEPSDAGADDPLPDDDGLVSEDPIDDPLGISADDEDERGEDVSTG